MNIVDRSIRPSMLCRFILAAFLIAVCSVSIAHASSAPSTLWEQHYGDGSGNDFIHSVWQTSDGGFILAGVKNSAGEGGASLWLVKTDVSGAQEWVKNYPEGTSDNAKGLSVRQTSDGGFIVAGCNADGNA